MTTSYCVIYTCAKNLMMFSLASRTHFVKFAAFTVSMTLNLA